MADQPRRSRRQKIEPLDYAEAALAPALKGMTSFLDLSPEDVRSGNFAGLVMQDGPAGRVSPPGPVSSPGIGNSGNNAARPVPKSVGPKRARVEAVSSSEDEASSIVGVTHQYASTADHKNAAAPGYVTSLEAFSSPDALPHQMSPIRLTPSRGRSAVRRCVLAQDGHSLGEEAIYQLLWRSGTPESDNPNDSRTVRLGAADIGYSVNMAKKNVRQNIARLFEKLAIEIVEDFGTMNSQARLYRVFSSMQILERRRSAGMEYVLRNKGVIFCERDGDVAKGSPAYVSVPGDEAFRPARPKRRRIRPRTNETPHYPELATKSGSLTDDGAGLKIVEEAIGRYWTVDHATVAELIRDCRRVCVDARAEEIAFFIHEKLELAKYSRSVNPMGLINATVPQSFAGSSFVEFRRRMEQHAALAAGEAERKRRNSAELNAWMTKERELLIATASDTSLPEDARSRAERQLRRYDWTG